MLITIYRSRLKIISAHTRPKTTAITYDSKTVYNAYPEEKKARTPVKKTVAPIPMYLLTSVGHFSRMEASTPEQKRKKFLSRVIIFSFGSSLQPGKIQVVAIAADIIIMVYTVRELLINFKGVNIIELGLIF
jgi:hypothetical protein